MIICGFKVPALGFGGTSVLIVVGVALDTLQQVESHLLMRHYEGFVKRGRIRGRSEDVRWNSCCWAHPEWGRALRARRLASEHGWALISTGDMLRDAVAKKTPLGLQAKQMIDQG